MRHRYALLLAATLGLALALTVLGRRVPRRPVAPGPPPATRVATRALQMRDRKLSPQEVVVAKGDSVRLEVCNRGGRRARFRIAGYDDRLPEAVLEPGETRWLAWRADRPGEDFAVLLDGRPAGRLRVAGSHLVEGHR